MTTPSAGWFVNRFNGNCPEIKELRAEAKFATWICWEAGAAPPATAVKINPDGRTSGPGSLPAGSDPGPLVRPSGLIFTAVAGGAAPASQQIQVANLASARSSFISGQLPLNLFTNQPAEGVVIPGQ